MVLDGAPSVVSMCFVRAQKNPGWGFGTGQKTHRDFTRCPAGCWAGLPVPSRGAPAGRGVTGKLSVLASFAGWRVPCTSDGKPEIQTTVLLLPWDLVHIPTLSVLQAAHGCDPDDQRVILMTSVVTNRSQTFKCQLCVAVSTRDLRGWP